MKIDKLTLKNFKFFYGEKTLNFEGKNILLYGENGSGKSSIYAALYTLLNNAKSPNIKIQNYFNHREKNRLLNRYIEEMDTGRVSITLDNGDEYAVSKDSVDIIQYKRGTTIEEGSIASDFINYKLLAKLYDFKHSQAIDLFDLFESDIFSYLKYDTHRNYDDVWESLLLVEQDAPKISSNSYYNFKRNINSFNQKLDTFLNTIMQSANEILTQYFYPNIEVKFSYKPLEYDSSADVRKYRKLIYPKINININLLNQSMAIEENRKVAQPHTFLNEAKLTAIALSIRLAILQTRLAGNNNNILKILVLDDLLISLDMNNRDIVVNMLLEDKYLKDYQVIMLTHDRAFYERSKQIFNYKAKGRWKYFEMFIEPHKTKDIEVPYINEFGQEYGDKERAEEHFRNRDYPAAANYLRKEVEKIYYKNLDLGKLESIMELSRKVDNYEKIETCFPELIKVLKAFRKCKNIPDKEVRAKKCILFADKVEKAFDVVYKIIKSDEFFDIGLMKDHILNPQSHDDLTKPLYKKELEDAFKGVELLQQAVEKNILNRMDKKREALRQNRIVSKYRGRK